MNGELQIRKAVNSEHSLMYSTLDPAIDKERGTIGHIRFYFDSAGSLICTWHGRDEAEVTQAFQNEWATVYGKLFSKKGMLTKWFDVVNWYYDSPDGYVMELNGYTAYMRLPNSRGEYGYVYFYKEGASK